MKVAQAKQQTASENPFYNCMALLAMQRFFEKSIDANTTQAQVNSVMAQAWMEVFQKDKALTELFFIITFNAGDISNREHNMFGGRKVQQGGHAKRKAFRYALSWMLTYQPEAFYNYLPLISEYTNYENLFYNQLRTDRKTGTLVTHDFLPVDHTRMADYIGGKVLDLKTTEFELGLIAKFLPKVPNSKRYRKDKEGKTVVREKKKHTVDKDVLTMQMIQALSTRMDWEVVDYKHNKRYVGYEKFRSAHLKNTEAHLFSTKKIMEFDKVQFLTWLEGLPAGARYRVQCRIVEKVGTTLTSKKTWKLSTGDDMGVVYLQWMKDKEEAMKKLVSLSEEDKKDMTKGELKALTKQAKVTTGGNTIYDSMLEIFKGGRGAETSVMLQTLIDKVKVDVPVLSIVDVSGSMGGGVDCGDGMRVSRLDFAKLIVSVMLYKNPDENLGSMFMTYGSDSTLYYDEGAVSTKEVVNRYVTGSTKSKKLPKLADRTKPFIDTYNIIRNLFNAEGVTNLQAVSSRLKAWTDEDPALKSSRIECIQQYPVWLIISDGMFNNKSSGPASLRAFKHDLLQYFGADPVVVLWNVGIDRGYGQDDDSSIFEDIDNFVAISGVNAAALNQVFLNLSDIDVVDIYTSLDALYKSDRYDPVKKLTL